MSEEKDDRSVPDGGTHTHQWLDQVRAEAAAQKLDFYTLVAAKNTGVPYADVTKAQRNAVKDALFAYTYGSKPGAKLKANITRPMPRSGGDQTAGWQNVIRRAGTEMVTREAARKANAGLIIEATRQFDGNDRVRSLMEAHDAGSIRTNELLDELRAMVGITQTGDLSTDDEDTV